MSVASKVAITVAEVAISVAASVALDKLVVKPAVSKVMRPIKAKANA